jgi:putative methyltransferase (TIGR04325 family)
VRWAVVEQAGFVRLGREKIAAPGLSFHATLAEAVAVTGRQLLFASSVVQYLPDPAAFLDEALGSGFDYVLFDRTAFHQGPRDRLTRQQNPKSLYRASYPAWFFNEPQFLARCNRTHELVYAFDGRDRVWLSRGRPYYRGFLFKRRAQS